MVFGQIKKPDFKDIKFPVKTTDIQKVEKKKKLYQHLFSLLWKQSKISDLCIKKCCEEKHLLLLLTREGEKKHYFNTFMYDHYLHLGRKHFVVIVCMFLVQKKY